jgi:hypothetical protein
MFQYAYSKALQKKGFDVRLDIRPFKKYKLHGGYQLDQYKIDIQNATDYEINKFKVYGLFPKIKKKLGFINKNTLNEDFGYFNQNLLNPEKDKYIVGYFQSEKYFSNVRETLLDNFIIKKEKSDYFNMIKKKIESSKISCSIHVRRGDFINKKNIDIHGACSLDYYLKSIEIMKSKYQNISFFIFSDDMPWTKKNLNIKNAIYVENELNRIPHEDIYLMTLCNHNIIANSSFSWWGAWLNKNINKLIIAPKIWFADYDLQKRTKDLICKDWTRL